MKCLRCQEVEVPSGKISHVRLSIEELREIGYCCSCIKKIRFERVKFVKRPYKIPINRSGI
jgi:hypothetical protein